MKAFLFATMAGIGLSAVAAVPTYQEAKPLGLPVEAHHPVLSPDGQLLLFTSMDHTGLQCLDIATGRVTTIDTESAAGFKPVFSNDGRQVYYRTSQYIDKTIWRDVRSYDMTKGVSTQLRQPSRETLSLKSIDNSTFATSDFSSINVTINGRSTRIKPVDDANSYLWASLSPDATRVLFVAALKGVYVCDIDGSNLRKVANQGAFPCWIDNNTVAAVVQSDDGYFVTSSRITGFDLSTGNSLRITDESILVDDFTASPLTGKIVYSTLDGEMFILNPNK